MSGLGGLNKSQNGVVIGLVQLQLPVTETKADLTQQTEKVCEMVRKAKRFAAPIDLVVFPEYMLHGLSMSMDKEIMCDVDGPEVEAFKDVCRENDIWGCFSIMEYNPDGNPYNTGLIIDNKGEIKLNYRKLHPWVPVEPWEPGDVGLPVCEGPNGSKLGLAICHDGMFPEVSRELAYKGADIILRTAGYTAPIRHSWRITNQSNAFCNLAYTASVAMCGTDGTNDSMGEGMIVNFDGVPMVEGSNRPDEIITGEVRPDLVREARTDWAVENNMYQLGHRGYVAVEGGITDAPYTYMQDLQNGEYRLPWEDDVVHKDGGAYGFNKPRKK
ncbi:formamidase [Salinicoccus roseus]|uniref:Formamidase n=1 Tax=Salinicoccus roseus TaxID=45670 RepID=A0A0C2HN13_9STAP|nr:formamidase [Salinicoccus roseus]KIH70876.1 formamidase [Salinicoccus roseus]MDB0580535.1 formamidase [Salinicoccus roseus]